MPEQTLSNYTKPPRGGKTEKAVEALRDYISGISKRDRKRIEQELEAEKDDDERVTSSKYVQTDWFKYPVTLFDPDPAQITYYYEEDNNGRRFPKAYYGNWASEPQNRVEIEEEVSDVNFED